MPDLVDDLARLIVQDNALLFVGAGLRCEAGQPALIQQIADALAQRIAYQRADRTLPAVARDFEVLRGRHDLILALREELEKHGSQPDQIHHLIADAVLPRTKVITTSFDHLLEYALAEHHKPYVLIVRDTDLPFFDETKVTVIKMQGDIGQPESLVITQDDIEDFISRLPTISDVVRAYFATKTLIFLGYDLAGEQFKKLFHQVTRNLAAYQRTAYAVTSVPVDEVEQRYWQSRNVRICQRDPFAFLTALAGAVRAAVQQPVPIPQPAAPSVPLPPRPYKALDSFTAADAAIFSGRAEESQRLMNRILANRLTTLYGESGSGKTSLLQAGVAPLLTQRGALPVACAVAAGRSAPALLAEALARAGEGAGLAQPADASVAGMIRAWQHARNAPVVLAFDQFEQLFLTYGDARAEALGLLRELLADRSLDVRLVLSLREDFLGRLQTLEADLPGLLDVRFRLERLGREASRAAIEEPARLFGIRWEPALVEALLDDLCESPSSGVAPPQLQIVCDRLYQAAIEGSGGGRDGLLITAAMLQAAGGVTAILGDYLDRAVLSFAPEQQPAVRALLGALVGSSGTKQRASFDELTCMTEVTPAEAQAILDELTRQRLVQRYELPGGDVEYELIHDSLVPHIARWLGADFWQAQKVREIVRRSLPEWEERRRLVAPEDLRLAAAQCARVRFLPAEVEMLYASAVGYGHEPQLWQARLSPQACQQVLLRLLEHADADVRGRAARGLAAYPDAGIAAAVTQMALADPAPTARDAAARAIADLAARAPHAGGQAAVAGLAAAAAAPQAAAAALAALVTVRDLQPASQAMLPAELRRTVTRRVWGLRWRRDVERIRTDTIRGVVGGFLGLGSSFALMVVSARQITNLSDLRDLVTVAVLLLIVGGLLGGLAAGCGVFVHAVLQSLQDRKRPIRNWGITACIGGTATALAVAALVSLANSVAGSRGNPIPGAPLIGLGLVGAAALPLKLPRAVRLILTLLAGAVVFVLAQPLNLFKGDAATIGVLAPMGVLSGLGFFYAFNRAARPT